MDQVPRDETAFQPIEGPRASDEVVDQLSHAVHTGLYEVGARLPRIDQLAQAMHVSKPTVSEAVRVLTRAGVLRVRRGAGGGIVVASSVIPLDILKRSRAIARTLREVVEARRPVEVELARLATMRATERDYQELRAAIRLQEEAGEDLGQWSFGNFKFHYTIGRAAGSRVLFHFQTELTKELAMFLEDWTPRDREYPEMTLAEHKAILAALQSRDVERVTAAVENHMLEVEALLPTPSVSPAVAGVTASA